MKVDEEVCQVKGCENEVFVDDYGICVCEEHLTPEMDTYLAYQARLEDERL